MRPSGPEAQQVRLRWTQSTLWKDPVSKRRQERPKFMLTSLPLSPTANTVR
jgi:hypothetical protein